MDLTTQDFLESRLLPERNFFRLITPQPPCGVFV
jgi:hypothetical protein